MVRVSCPYCNAVVDVESGRVACPRCGEAFESANAEHIADDVAVSKPASPPRPPGFLYSRSAMALSFGLAFAILAGGLAILRPWETKPKPVEVRLPVVVSPLGLSGLVYLPPSTNIVAAVQPMPLLAYAAQAKIDPRKFLVEAGVPDVVFENLSKAGVPLDQIDHLVVGLSVSSEKGSIIPGVTACLKLTRPIADESKFLAQLRAEKNSQQSKGGRTVYSISNSLLMTAVDERTYLFGFGEVDLAFFDKPQATGGSHLPKELREALTNRISPASFAWIATDSTNWSDKPGVQLAKSLPEWKPRFEKLKSLRAVAGGLSLEPEPELRLGTRWDDAIGTNTFQDRLKTQFKDEAAQVAGDEGWATVRTPIDLKSGGIKSFVREWMNEK